MVYRPGLSDLSAAFERIHGTALPTDINTAIKDVQASKVVKTDASVLPDWQFDPVDFRTFCESPKHMKMLPSDWKYGTGVDEYGDGALSKKQYHDCIAILGDDPLLMFDPAVRKYKFGGLLWSKGCIGEDTMLFDELTQKQYKVSDIARQGLPLAIKVYNGQTHKIVIKPVQRVFSKGIAARLLLTFASGRSIIVAPEHRFLTDKDLGRWQTVKELLSTSGRLLVASVPSMHSLFDLDYDEITSYTALPPGEIFDLTVDEETPNYFTADGLLHHNSGKDLVCSLMQAYVVHVLLCMKNPQDYFGFALGEPCDILNVGTKGDQAERTYFTKFRARLLQWEWMLDKYNVTDEGRRFRFNGKGYPICKIGTRSAEWLNKSVRAFSENSGNPGSLEGYNIVFYLFDEISSWASPAERKIAEQILGILRTSQSSRNTKKLAGLGLAISYPRQDDDIMFDLEKESFKPDSTTFFSRGLQWDVKPKRGYSGKTFKFNAGTEDLPEWIDIPAELDESFFNTNPEQAKCYYLLRPPPVGGPFFEYTEKLDSVAFKDRTPLFKVETSYIDSVDGKGNKIVYVRKKILGVNRQPGRNVDYVAWMDAADSMCDAALSIGHLEQVTLVEDGERRETTVVVLDDTIIWEPDPKLRRIVDIGSMTTCCIDMLRYITLKIAWWDQWNSGTGMFDLRRAGIMCDKHNLSGEDYDFFKGMLYSSRFIAPDCAPVIKGIEQLKHLSRTRTNNVTPGSVKHKKDVSDTWCGVTVLLLGSLAPNSSLRVGRAPTSISIGGSAPSVSMGGGGVTGVGNTNPFGARNSGMATRDHSDLFKSLSPMSGHRGGGMPAPRSAPAPRQTAMGDGPKFPRGVRL